MDLFFFSWTTVVWALFWGIELYAAFAFGWELVGEWYDGFDIIVLVVLLAPLIVAAVMGLEVFKDFASTYGALVVSTILLGVLVARMRGVRAACFYTHTNP